MKLSKSRKRILNSAGTAAQQGKLGDVIDELLEQNEKLSLQNEEIKAEIDNITSNITVTCTFVLTKQDGTITGYGVDAYDVLDINSIPKPITVPYGTCVQKPTDPVKRSNLSGYGANFTFGYWAEPDGGAYDFSKPLKKNITLEACIVPEAGKHPEM